MEKIIFIISEGLIWTLAIKTIIGYHFPWETCECCGRKYKDHNKRINEVD